MSSGGAPHKQYPEASEPGSAPFLPQSGGHLGIVDDHPSPDLDAVQFVGPGSVSRAGQWGCEDALPGAPVTDSPG